MGWVCLVHIIRAQKCNAPFVLSIIPRGAIRTRVEQASVTWATCNKLTHLITLTLTSIVLDAKGRSLGEGEGLSPETSSEPLMSLGLFTAATVHAGAVLSFWCAHSPFAYLPMASRGLPTFYSSRWCEVWFDDRHLTYILTNIMLYKPKGIIYC